MKSIKGNIKNKGLEEMNSNEISKFETIFHFN